MMKKRILAMILSMAMALTMLPATPVQAVDTPGATEDEFVTAGDAPAYNLARTATASASYVNGENTPGHINDGLLAIASGVQGDPGNWNCWGHPGTGENTKYPVKVTLTWDEAQTISSMRVMWWSDGSVIPFPGSATLKYKDADGNFVPISKPVGVEHGGNNGEDGIWNVVNFDTAISTTELQMSIDKQDTAIDWHGVAISEWEVYGKKIDPERIIAAKITGPDELLVGHTATYTGSVRPDSAEEGTTYAWSVPESSQSLITIEGAANEKMVSVKALAEGEDKAVLHLTATKNNVVQETDFELQTMTEETRLRLEAEYLYMPEKIASEFTLIDSIHGYTVAWASDNAAIQMIGARGIVTQKDNERQKVKLTATLTGKDAPEGEQQITVTKDFNVVVYEKNNLAGDAEVSGSYEASSGAGYRQIHDRNDSTGWDGWRLKDIPEEDYIIYDFTGEGKSKLGLTGSYIRYKDNGVDIGVPEKVEFQYFDDNTDDWKIITPDDGGWAAAEPEKDIEYKFKDKIITDRIKLIITNATNMQGVRVGTWIYEWALIGEKYVKPDLSGLEQAISDAQATLEAGTSGKPQDKVEALQNAIVAAQAVVNDKNPTQAQVDEALSALEEANSALGGLNKAALRAVIATATQLKNANHDEYEAEADWAGLDTALTAANEALTATDQATIDTAATNLNNKITEINGKKKPSVVLDKTALTTAITTATQLKNANHDDYEADADWAGLDTALTAANAALTATDQATINTAATNLNNKITEIENKKKGGNGPTPTADVTLPDTTLAVGDIADIKVQYSATIESNLQTLQDCYIVASNSQDRQDKATSDVIEIISWGSTPEYGIADPHSNITIRGLKAGTAYIQVVINADNDSGPANKPIYATATITVTGGGIIEPPTKVSIENAEVTIPDCTYNKKEQTPEVTVKVGEKTLVKDTDYTVSYENNINAGTAKAVITAKEDSGYTGSVNRNFTINKANAVITARNITKTIGEKNFSFGATVDSKGTLSCTSKNTKVIKVVNGKAQIVNTGTAKITIKAAATANYNAATKTITIMVNKPNKATLSKVESKKSGQLKVTWKKDAKATGYKVMYSTDKKFKNKNATKTITVKKNKTVSKTIKKLKKGKKYYVKVCSYVKVGKKEYLGAYSKVKNIKIKK